jgi:tetratricopeptide (TPR) repeat protein
VHGLAAMGDERWDESIVAFRHFLELVSKPDDRGTAYQNLAACYLALERYDGALAMLDEAERYSPDVSEAVHSRGVTFACAGRLPEAIATFEEFARRWSAQVHRREIKKTIRQLRRAQQGEIPPGTYLVDHLQEQISHNVEMGDFHLVERKARRIIAADPDRPEGHFALGIACMEQGRYPEALEAFLAAHSRDPDYAPTLHNIGHLYLELGEPDEALPWLERSLRQAPQHVATLHQLGVACEQLGRRGEAVGWWRRALGIDPDYDLAQQRLYEIGEGPAPAEPPLTPRGRQLRAMSPVVKARMTRPKVHRNGGVTLTYDPQVGFVLEDSENPLNATVYAGNPFEVGRITDKDLLDLMGVVKLVLHMINVENTRDVAVLAYYAGRPVFSYQARFEGGEAIDFHADGRFIVNEVPRFFKLRIDSDLSSPYADPMQGTLIYLSQHPEAGILVSTLGLITK